MKHNLKNLVLPLLLICSLPAPAAVLAPSRNLPASAFTATTEDQNLTLLSSGLASFRKRLQLIESATKSIDTEFYIYQSDDAGRLYTQALLEKARQGVRVRVLIDRGFGNQNLDPQEVQMLVSKGLEVRYYNDTPLIQFNKSNHRSHRKSLIVDQSRAIMGGRNMANDYFDLSAEYNMLDQDVLVEGSIVRAIGASFENFWNSDLSKPSPAVTEPQMVDYGFETEAESSQIADGETKLRKFKRAHKAYILGLEKAKSLLITTEKDLALKKRFETYGDQLLAIAPSSVCHETYYYADLPGNSSQSRVVYDQLTNLIATTQKTLSVESPFFIRTETESLFKKAVARGVKVEILTNSLYSSDVPLSIAPFLSYAKDLTSLGANVFVFEGDSPRWLDFGNRMAKTARWGTHAKTLVIDGENILVGSFNMDPRSAFLNAEMAIVCRGNSDLAAGLSLDRERRKSIAVPLNANGDPVDGRSKFFNVDQNKRFFYYLTKPFAEMFKSQL